MPEPVAARLAGSDVLGRAIKGLAPLVLLAVLVGVFLRFGPVGVFEAAFPPLEDLTIERVTMPAPGELRVRVVNGGADAVTIAQVLVDEASWDHTVNGDRTIGRLESRIISIPYPWVEGEPHTVSLLTSTGLTFTATVDVATQTPRPDARYLGTFAMLGIYVGVIPVFLGLLWLPFLKAVGRKWVDFFLSLTVGLLVFLGVDALVEAVETATLVPGGFHGIGIVLLGVAGTPLMIHIVSAHGKSSAEPTAYRVSGLIAVAIGLHNLGEGLAVGAAYSSGAIALGTFLVLGFLVHNTTEGLGIVAPLAAEKPNFRQLATLGLVAGAPTIIGAWIGGFTYSPIWTTFFFAIGAGAIAQVVLILSRRFLRGGAGSLSTLNATGVLLGLAIMYGTSLLVIA